MGDAEFALNITLFVLMAECVLGLVNPVTCHLCLLIIIIPVHK